MQMSENFTVPGAWSPCTEGFYGEQVCLYWIIPININNMQPSIHQMNQPTVYKWYTCPKHAHLVHLQNSGVLLATCFRLSTTWQSRLEIKKAYVYTRVSSESNYTVNYQSLTTRHRRFKAHNLIVCITWKYSHG